MRCAWIRTVSNPISLTLYKKRSDHLQRAQNYEAGYGDVSKGVSVLKSGVKRCRPTETI